MRFAFPYLSASGPSRACTLANVSLPSMSSVVLLAFVITVVMAASRWKAPLWSTADWRMSVSGLRLDGSASTVSKFLTRRSSAAR